MSQFKITIKTVPCRVCEKLLQIIPKIKALYPAVPIEIIESSIPLTEPDPKTTIFVNGPDGRMHERGRLYGFINESHHLTFISNIVDAEMFCELVG
jgi:hypothetical protein